MIANLRPQISSARHGVALWKHKEMGGPAYGSVESRSYALLSLGNAWVRDASAMPPRLMHPAPIRRRETD
jgi:hypothetical protein